MIVYQNGETYVLYERAGKNLFKALWKDQSVYLSYIPFEKNFAKCWWNSLEKNYYIEDDLQFLFHKPFSKYKNFLLTKDIRRKIYELYGETAVCQYEYITSSSSPVLFGWCINEIKNLYEEIENYDSQEINV